MVDSLQPIHAGLRAAVFLALGPRGSIFDGLSRSVSCNLLWSALLLRLGLVVGENFEKIRTTLTSRNVAIVIMVPLSGIRLSQMASKAARSKGRKKMTQFSKNRFHILFLLAMGLVWLVQNQACSKPAIVFGTTFNSTAIK